MKILAERGKVKFKYLCVVEEVEITEKKLSNSPQRISGKTAIRSMGKRKNGRLVVT